jgi:hypothetical protein
MSDMTQLAILFAATVIIFGGAALVLVGERLYRTFRRGSASFITANAATNLTKKIDHLIGPGVELIIPAGKGIYPLVTDGRGRASWEGNLDRWIKRGAQISILITMPNDEGATYWKRLSERLESRLDVWTLDRDRASAEDAADIHSLDTFHPILVVKNGTPLAMWIESYHPFDSAVAYNVEFIATRDIIDYQRARFDRYLRVLRRLMTRQPTPSLSAAESAAPVAEQSLVA